MLTFLKPHFMGKYLKGIFGPFSGLIGIVVGATWKGLWLMRSRPIAINRPASEAQMVLRARFTMISQFLSPVDDLLIVGIQAYNSELSPFNAAFAINRESAVTGTYPMLSIDYQFVVIAKGRLLAVPQVTVATTVDAQLDFSRLNNAGPGSTNGTDAISFLVYNPAKQAYAKMHNAANFYGNMQMLDDRFAMFDSVEILDTSSDQILQVAKLELEKNLLPARKRPA